MSGQTCDFCGTAFEWTPERVALDQHLRLFSTFCTGLGAMCDACDDKQIQLAIAQERKDRKAEYDMRRRERVL